MKFNDHNHLITHSPNVYDFLQYGMCSDQTARFCKLDEIKDADLNFLFANVQRWLVSKKRADMIEGERYYRNENDILDRKRYFIGRQGQKIENKNVSNAKLNHPLFRKIVQQKLGYILGKLPDIKTDMYEEIETKQTNDSNIPQPTKTERIDEYADILQAEYFDKDFMRILKILLKEAIVKGVGWLQVYYNEEGKLSFQVIPSEEILPFWGDSMHTKLDGIIRTYTVDHYKDDGSVWVIRVAEFYSKKGSWKFVINNGQIEEIEYKKENFLLNSESQMWNEIPFINFNYNEDNLPLLNLVKNLIDAYDLTTSDFDNLLRDIPNSIKVIKNYERSEDETEDSFTRNLALFRTIFVRDNGGVEALENPIDSASIEEHLTRLKKDIFEMSSAVEDTDGEKISDNLSGVALAFKYTNLDIEAGNIQSEFEKGFQRLKYFIDTDMALKGHKDYSKNNFEVIFNKNLITNDANNCDSLVKLYQAGLISLETAVEKNPFVEDRDKEVDKIQGEKLVEEQKQQEQMKMQMDFKSKQQGGGNE